MLRIVRIGSHKKTQDQNEVSFTLIAGKKYTIGRKDCDLSFGDDGSISRSHAELQVEHPIANVNNPSLTPTVLLTDLGSKFGTYVNDGIDRKSKISVREPQVLTGGDRIRFGLQWNEYKIEYTPQLVTSSTLKGSDSAELKQNIRSLGGHFVGEWTEDTDMLVMENITMTAKVICALLAGKPIVTPSYFTDYKKVVEEADFSNGEDLDPRSIPNFFDFLPPLVEPTLAGNEDLFQPDVRRKTLFQNQHFLVDTRVTFKTYKAAIEAGGGKISVLADVPLQVVRDRNSIILGIETELREDEQLNGTIQEYLDCGKSVIPKREIGLCALFSDKAKYCNPYASSSTDDMICPETQEYSAHFFPTQSNLSRIPNTQSPIVGKRGGEDDPAETSGRKRRLDSSETETTPSSQNNQKRLKETKSKEELKAEKSKRILSLLGLSSDSEDETEAETQLTISRTQQSRSSMDQDEFAFPSTTQNDRAEDESEAETQLTISRTHTQQSIGSSMGMAHDEFAFPSTRAQNGKSQDSFIVDETQEESDRIILSGIIPPSPSISSEGSTSTVPSPRQKSMSTRSDSQRDRHPVSQNGHGKRKQEEEVEIVATKNIRKKKQRMDNLNDTKIEMDIKPIIPIPPSDTPTSQPIVHDIPSTFTVSFADDVTKYEPLEYEFKSLVLTSRPPPPSKATQEPALAPGLINFKRFKKTPGYHNGVTPRVRVKLVPHDQMSTEVEVVVVQEEGPPSPSQAPAPPTPPPPSTRAKNQPTKKKPPPRRRSPRKRNGKVNEDNDFNFNF